jgi:O-antigen/teichoic acid export membrane protein
MSNSENNKRIAKNTLLLYFRMFLMMGVSLFTSRIVLNTIGISDFGIYNVVGGVVMMVSFLNSSMSSATQRFLSFELGKNNFIQLKKVFCMSINIHVIIAFTILILAETIGLWFLNAKLVIPVERMEAANWVYQFSIFSFIISVLSVPYNASIIARERMNIYAYISIAEVFLKLFIVFVLLWFGLDKLKLYSVLIFCVALIVFLIYRTYCIRNFSESKYTFFWDKSMYKTLINYASWNLFGNLAAVTFNQGINILLNIFFGPLINAARGIAYQVNSAVNSFVSNFQMAMNPQIVKSYASGDTNYMHQLIFQGSKYSFFLLYFLSLPLLMETQTILIWWLKIVPEHTMLFCRLVLVNTLIDCISGPLMTAAQASGKIKKYQVIVGGLLLLILPISYVFLRIGYPPQTTLYVSISVSIIALLSRLWLLKDLIQLSIKEFVIKVLSVVMLITFSSLVIPLYIRLSMDSGLGRFLIICFVSVCCTIASIYILGLNKQEKDFMNRYFFILMNKLKSRH